MLGAAESAAAESFGADAAPGPQGGAAGLLDWPHYTRPEQWRGRRVPEVLRGGDHAAIRRWRLKEALGRTCERRPDLMAGRELSNEERGLLDEYREEHESCRTRSSRK